jgi:rfaE bifunctional protein nucleotidyltransferase chain/domain
MSKIISPDDIPHTAKIFHNQNKKFVLVGGCFDILHIGHITFLEEAKKHGEILVVLLESDSTITKTKGANRPINSQEDRAKILAALYFVDIVVLLNPEMTDKNYDALVFTLKPAIIATTFGDINKKHKERQAKEIGAQVIDVTKQISDKSTTKLVKLLNEI